VAADGALEGFSEIEHKCDIDKIQAGEFPAGEGGIILIALFLAYFCSFLAAPQPQACCGLRGQGRLSTISIPKT
jgi:hypothetical protein